MPQHCTPADIGVAHVSCKDSKVIFLIHHDIIKKW